MIFGGVVLDKHGDGVAALVEDAGGQLVRGRAHVDAADLEQLVTDLQADLGRQTCLVHRRHEDAARVAAKDLNAQRLRRLLNVHPARRHRQRKYPNRYST